MNPLKAEREGLIDELSELAIRIIETGGPGALAACSVALVEGAAAAVPGPLLTEFITQLLKAVTSGAKRAGHEVTAVALGDACKSEESVH